MPGQRRVNRGRSAAAHNRRALLAAAREVFAAGGLHAPLSAVARTAGVGQGSLYRHFPDRIELALAVFEDSVAELEKLAAEPASTLSEVLEFTTRQSIASVAFVDVISSATEDPRLDRIAQRLTAAIALKVGQARERSEIGSRVDEHQLLLAVAMVANLVAKVPPEDRRTFADRAWSILYDGLSGDAP